MYIIIIITVKRWTSLKRSCVEVRENPLNISSQEKAAVFATLALPWQASATAWRKSRSSGSRCWRRWGVSWVTAGVLSSSAAAVRWWSCSGSCTYAPWHPLSRRRCQLTLPGESVWRKLSCWPCFCAVAFFVAAPVPADFTRWECVTKAVLLAMLLRCGFLCCCAGAGWLYQVRVCDESCPVGHAFALWLSLLLRRCRLTSTRWDFATKAVLLVTLVCFGFLSVPANLARWDSVMETVLFITLHGFLSVSADFARRDSVMKADLFITLTPHGFLSVVAGFASWWKLFCCSHLPPLCEESCSISNNFVPWLPLSACLCQSTLWMRQESTLKVLRLCPSGWLTDCVTHHPSEISRRQLLFDALMLLCSASTESVTLAFCGWLFDFVRAPPQWDFTKAAFWSDALMLLCSASITIGLEPGRKGAPTIVNFLHRAPALALISMAVILCSFSAHVHGCDFMLFLYSCPWLWFYALSLLMSMAWCVCFFFVSVRLCRSMTPARLWWKTSACCDREQTPYTAPRWMCRALAGVSKSTLWVQHPYHGGGFFCTELKTRPASLLLRFLSDWACVLSPSLPPSLFLCLSHFLSVCL